MSPQSQLVQTGRSVLWFWVWLGLLILYAIVGQWGEIGSKPAILPSLKFILMHILAGCLCLAFLLLIPRKWTASQKAWLIIITALLCRLLLLPLPPSDDINRYLWEGRLLNEGISPYHFAPDSPVLDHLAKNDPYHDQINHPYNPAAYPPLALYLFSWTIKLSYTPLAIKILIVLADMGAVLFLFKLLHHRRLDLRWSTLYALNPLVLLGFAGHAHFDAIQTFFMLGALCFFDRRRWFWMFLWLGLAVQSKYMAVVIIPFLMNRENWKYLWICCLAVIVPYLPLLNAQWPELFLCIIRFGEQYAFNGSIHGIFRYLLGGIEPAVTVSKISIAVLLLFGYWRFHPLQKKIGGDPVTGCFFAFAVLLLLAPTVHFWYLTWILPFVVLRPSLSWIILCLSISFYFVVFSVFKQTGEWTLPVWAQLAEWVPFYLLLSRDIFLYFQRRRNNYLLEPVNTISVVIPVKNEGGHIQQCIAAIQDDPAVSEIIVVNGDSADDTSARAREAGARVIEHPNPPEKGGGRGGQILAGVQAARGDVVAIVHADILVVPNSFSDILEVLYHNPTIIGGALGSLFNDKNFRYRLLEFANDVKAVYFGISFGDQVQFFRRKPVVDNDVFPDIPLMEDVELSLRLHRWGRQVYLFGNSLVSTRRWMKKRTGNLLTILWQFLSYLLIRLWKTPDTLRMYRNYYK